MRFVYVHIAGKKWKQLVEKEFILKGKPVMRLHQEATKKGRQKIQRLSERQKILLFFPGKQTGIIPEFHFLQAGIDPWP